MRLTSSASSARHTHDCARSRKYAAAPSRVDGVVTEGVRVRIVADTVAAADFVHLLRAEVAQAREDGFASGRRGRDSEG